MKRIISLMFAAVLCCSIQSLSAVDSAGKASTQSASTSKYKPEVQSAIDNMSSVAKEDWDSFSAEDKNKLINMGMISTSLPSLPCGVNISDFGGVVLHCTSGPGPNCSAALKTAMNTIFDDCCPAGSKFTDCSSKFLSFFSTVGGYPGGSIIENAIIKYGFNATTCAVSSRIPHLGLLLGGDPAGNMQNCFGTLTLTDAAKSFITKCTAGQPAVASSTDCSSVRYQVLQNGVNWGSSPIDCLSGGTYSTQCSGMTSTTTSCPVTTWGSGC